VGAPHCLVGPETIGPMLALAEKAPAGAFLELGVYHGGTAWHLEELAERQRRTLYLCDTFRGIPYQDQNDSHHVGQFGDTSLAEVRAALHGYAGTIFVEGVFPESIAALEPFFTPLHGIAFAHLDCDQYRSYRDALAWLDSHMVTGGLIWCDDVPCLQGAADALNEYAARTGRTIQLAEKAFIRY